VEIAKLFGVRILDEGRANAGAEGIGQSAAPDLIESKSMALDQFAEDNASLSKLGSQLVIDREEVDDAL
jgi:hypothetical protein